MLQYRKYLYRNNLPIVPTPPRSRVSTPRSVVRTVTNRERPARGKVFIFYSTSQSLQSEEIRLITPSGRLVTHRNRCLRALTRLLTPFCYLTLWLLLAFASCHRLLTDSALRTQGNCQRPLSMQSISGSFHDAGAICVSLSM